MVTSQERHCFDQTVLERLLAEQLHGAEEARVLAHIATCASCRDKLGNLAGNDGFEPELREHLDPDSFDKLAATSVLGEEDQLERTDIDQIKNFLAPTDDPNMLGRLGHYEICGMVGHGSNGVVFKALDKRLNRYVAIKLLAPAYAGSGPARQRFEREGRSIAAVRDENVIPVFAVDDYKGLPYIVMEYLPCGSLAQRIDKEGPLDTCEVVRIGMQIAIGLEAAHKQGIIHRDVKPANVLLESGVERAVVTDFGLARIPDEVSMTRSGVISGTPQFMSPEQARGESVDQRSDLFSLGSVMYNACTGHSPFRSETVFGVIKRVCDTEPRPIRETNSNIDPWLCDFIEKLHAKDANDRFQSAEEVAELLEKELAYLQAPTVAPRPDRNWRKLAKKQNAESGRRWLVPAIVVTSFLAVAALWFAVDRFGNKGLMLSAGSTDNSNWSTKARGLMETGPFAVDQDTWNGITDKVSIVQHAKHTSGQLGGSLFGDEDDADINEFEEGVEEFENENFEDAIVHFKKASKKGNYGGKAAYNVACSYALLKKKTEAFRWLDKAVEKGYSDIKHFQNDSDLGNVHDDERFAKLIQKMERREKFDRLTSKGVQLRQRGEYEQANELFEEILAEDPDFEPVFVEYGFSLHMLGKLEEALKWHMKAAATENYNHFGNYNVACYYSLKGDKDKACEYLKKAIEAGMSDVRLIESDSDMDAIREDERYQTLIEDLEKKLRADWTEDEQECYSLIEAVEKGDHQHLQKLLRKVQPNLSCPDWSVTAWNFTSQKMTPLSKAIELGDTKSVAILVKADANVEQGAGWTMPPLMLAAKIGQLDIAKLLVKEGAEPKAEMPGVGSAMIFAAAGGQKEMMEYLTEREVDIDASVDGVGTPLIAATREGKKISVEWLLEKDADVNASTPGVGNAISVAGAKGDLGMLGLLIIKGGKVDAEVKGMGTPLMIALRAGQVKAAEFLIDKGADVNASVPGVGTPLSVSAGNGDLESVQLLLDEEVDVDATCNGVGTALCVASRSGRVQAAKMLLDAGANPNRVIAGVETPLAIAVQRTDKTMVRLLMEGGADPRLDAPGTPSAVELAQQMPDSSVLKLLSTRPETVSL